MAWATTGRPFPFVQHEDKNFHEESYQLIVLFAWLFGYQFLRYVEHLFHCEIFCIFDGMEIV